MHFVDLVTILRQPPIGGVNPLWQGPVDVDSVKGGGEWGKGILDKKEEGCCRCDIDFHNSWEIVNYHCVHHILIIFWIKRREVIGEYSKR